MTDAERRQKLLDAAALFSKTTTSYPDWLRHVAAGDYTPRDGSRTNWGKALALLQVVTIDLAPAPQFDPSRITSREAFGVPRVARVSSSKTFRFVRRLLRQPR